MHCAILIKKLHFYGERREVYSSTSHKYIYIYICTYVCICVCIHIYLYMHVCMHIRDLWSYLPLYIGIGGDEGLAGSPKHWRGLDRDGRWWRGKRKLRFHLPACHSDTTYNVGSWRRRSIHCNLYKMAAVFGALCIKRFPSRRDERNKYHPLMAN